MVAICHACRATIEELGQVGHRDECPRCGADLHCCKSCRFYDERSSRSCREPQAEPPRDKDRTNFCEFFQLAPPSPGEDGPSEADRARAAFDALFKK